MSHLEIVLAASAPSFSSVRAAVCVAPGSRLERSGPSPGKSGVIFLSNDRDKRSPSVLGKRYAPRGRPRHGTRLNHVREIAVRSARVSASHTGAESSLRFS